MSSPRVPKIPHSKPETLHWRENKRAQEGVSCLEAKKFHKFVKPWLHQLLTWIIVMVSAVFNKHVRQSAGVVHTQCAQKWHKFITTNLMETKLIHALDFLVAYRRCVSFGDYIRRRKRRGNNFQVAYLRAYPEIEEKSQNKTHQMVLPAPWPTVEPGPEFRA